MSIWSKESLIDGVKTTLVQERSIQRRFQQSKETELKSVLHAQKIRKKQKSKKKKKRA